MREGERDLVVARYKGERDAWNLKLILIFKWNWYIHTYIYIYVWKGKKVTQFKKMDLCQIIK